MTVMTIESTKLDQVSQLTLQLRATIEILETDRTDEFVLHDPVRGKYFQIGQDELNILKRLDSSKTVLECLTAHSLVPETAIPVISRFIDSGLLNGTRDEMRAVRRRNEKKRFAWLKWNPLCFRIPLGDPSPLLDRFSTNAVFSRWTFLIWSLVVVLAAAVCVSEWERLFRSATNVFAPGQWWGVLFVWLAMKVVHELGHGLASKHYGVKPRDAGVLVLLFTPMAFIDTTDSWQIRSRQHRMLVSAAGMYFEIVLSAIALLVWNFLEPGNLSTICFNIFMSGTVTTLLFNANPLMRFDGYFLLSDFLGISNLYGKGSGWLKRIAGKVLFGIRAPSVCSEREQIPVSIYGCLAFVWRIVVVVSLIMAAIIIFPDLGLLLGVVAVLTWAVLPLSLGIRRLWGLRRQIQIKRAILTVVCSTLLLVALFSVLHAPTAKSAPALVQFRDEFIVRAPADSFFEQLFVQDGQTVEKGEIMVVLRNPELELELVQLASEIEKSKIRIRICREANQFENVGMESDKLDSLVARLANKQTIADSLTLKAPHRGMILGRKLTELEGCFFEEGQKLFRLCDPEQKRIVVSLEQTDESALVRLKDQPVRVELANAKTVTGVVETVVPVATTLPRYPELTAVRGGPIPVRNLGGVDADKIRFLRPRILMEVSIPKCVSRDLFAGQRGYAVYSSNAQSLGRYFYESLTRWGADKLDSPTQ